MPESSPQDFLFQWIRELIPAKASLVDTVAEILHVSSDSAYRRIRGETLLVLNEAKLLCDHFQLSLDHLFLLKNHSVVFEHSRLDLAHYDYDRFLLGLLQQLKNMNQSVNPEMIYCSKDLPVFHNFYFRPVFAFRYFFWMRTFIQHPDFQGRKFNMDCLSDATELIGRELTREYAELPSIEILNTECINAIISQIEFCKDAGYFSNPGDIRSIYDSLESTILHLKDQVDYGAKFLPADKNPSGRKKNFNFYYNRVLLGDNTILVSTGQERQVFLNYEALSYLNTKDKDFCDGCYSGLQHLMKKGSIISATSEKQRNIFFGILLGKITDRIKAITNK